MKKKVEKMESVYLEQLHYEKMEALKWKMLAIVFMIVALVSNIIWVVVWNDAEYVEEVVSEDVITETLTTINQDGEYNNMEGVDINNGSEDNS